MMYLPAPIGKKSGADSQVCAALVPGFSWRPGNYFFAFLAVGTVAMVCRMRPAIL